MFHVTIQSHGLSAGARTHYVTANGVRNGLNFPLTTPSNPTCFMVRQGITSFLMVHDYITSFSMTMMVSNCPEWEVPS